MALRQLHPIPTPPCRHLKPFGSRWQATPVLLPRKSHGWRSLVGCSPWGRFKSDTTERLHFHFSLSHNVEGNGNPLQCSCLENPRDGRAWWAAVYGVAQSRTRLKRLSSSSSRDKLRVRSQITVRDPKVPSLQHLHLSPHSRGKDKEASRSIRGYSQGSI